MTQIQPDTSHYISFMKWSTLNLDAGKNNTMLDKYVKCIKQYRISSNKSNTPIIQTPYLFKNIIIFSPLIIRTHDSNNSNGTFSGIN